jgi:hypothetical protein
MQAIDDDWLDWLELISKEGESKDDCSMNRMGEQVGIQLMFMLIPYPVVEQHRGQVHPLALLL